MNIHGPEDKEEKKNETKKRKKKKRNLTVSLIELPHEIHRLILN